MKKKDLVPALSDDAQKKEKVFELASETFRLMATPMRLKIINALCQSEKNVTQLVQELQTTQPNISQHLLMLYRAGILGKRREGVQIHYRIVDQSVVNICRSVCTQVAIDLG